MQGAEERRLRRMDNTSHGGAIDGNAADDTLMVIRIHVVIWVRVLYCRERKKINLEGSRAHMLEQGLIQIYTGDSGRFNFAPVGLALRAAGQKLRSRITCFYGHELMDGLPLAAEIFKPYLFVDPSAHRLDTGDREAHGAAVLGAFQAAADACRSGEFDLVILNGAVTALACGMIPLRDVLRLMDDRPARVELVLSGRGAPPQIVERADLVTEMAVAGPAESPWTGSNPEAPYPVDVITGNGKGKTTYCLGKAMLASCMGFRSAFLQFMKSPQRYGEVMAIEKLPYLTIRSMGAGFLDPHAKVQPKKHHQAARVAWEYCLREIFSLKYGLVVLDEINTATHYGLLNPRRVREMLFLKPQSVHLLLSGRNAHPDVVEAASTVLEMREIKHPFRKGIKARRGIEF
jgi:cob(I)alamin adenosyltransferase